MLIIGQSGSGKTTLIKNQIKNILENTDDKVFVFPEDDFEYKEFLYHKNFSVINRNSKQGLNELLDNNSKNKLWVFFDNFYGETEPDMEFNLFLKRARKWNVIVTLSVLGEDFTTKYHFDNYFGSFIFLLRS